jgi:hypothetical protein
MKIHTLWEVSAESFVGSWWVTTQKKCDSAVFFEKIVSSNVAFDGLEGWKIYLAKSAGFRAIALHVKHALFGVSPISDVAFNVETVEAVPFGAGISKSIREAFGVHA